MRVWPVPGHCVVPGTKTTELTVRDVEEFFEKTLTKLGSGARIDGPKQYRGRGVYVVIRKLRTRASDRTARRPDRAEGSPQYLVPEPPKAKD